VTQDKVAQWRAVATVQPAIEQQAVWLWSVLEEEYDDELRGHVLRFATGSSRVGSHGIEKFGVGLANGGDDRLPTAMTCGCLLLLPAYSSSMVLSKQLRTAVESCSTFAFA